MRLPRNIRRMVVGVSLVIAWMLVIAGPAAADQTFTVNRLTDDGDGVCDSTCTLRDAVDAANASPGPDHIVLPAGTLRVDKPNSGGTPEDDNATGDIDINGAVTISGAGALATTIQSFVPDRVLDVHDVDVSLTDLSIAGGNGDGFGGGIYSPGADQLTLERVTVHDNTVTFKEAVFAHGGGIYKGAGNLIVKDSTIYNNGAGAAQTLFGGGIYLETASAQLENDTITGNSATSAGGGIHSANHNLAILDFVTITGNSGGSGGGGITDTSHFQMRSSVVAGNIAATDSNCGVGAGQSQGGNVGDPACGFTQPTDVAATDPMLGPLGGTPIPVEEPLPGSPALDRGAGPCPATDARGVPRPQGAACDSGAAERPVASPPPGGGGGGGVAAPHFSLASKLRVAANLRTIALKLACPASAGHCTGSVKIVGTVAKTSARRKTRKVTIASGRYSIAGGKTGTLKLKVTKAGRKAIRGHRSLSAKLTLSVTDAAGHKGSQSRTVKLARAKK